MAFNGEHQTVRTFNEKLLDFLEDLKPLLSALPAYTLVSSSVKWVCQFDPVKNYELFHKHVMIPYGDRISRRDENFFMEDLTVPISIEGNNNTNNSNGGGMGIVNLLRNLWKTQLNDADKTAVWAHLEVLQILCKRCVQAQIAATQQQHSPGRGIGISRA